MNLKGHIIKHKKYRDVAFSVIKYFDTGKKLKIQGHWINQAFVESFVMNPSAPRLDKIVIEKKDLTDWLICQNPNAKCIRYETWTPIRPPSGRKMF